MHCRRAEERIQAVLDERKPLRSDAELSGHLTDCQACRELARTYQQIAQAFFQPRRAVARRAPGPMHRRWRWSRLPVPAALAAAAAGLALWISQGPAPVETRLAGGDRVRAAGPATNPRPSAHGAAEAPANLSSEPFANWFALSSMSVTLTVSLDQLPPPTRQWVEPVSGGFKPVTRSVEAAFGAMRDTVLGVEPAARS